MPWEIIEIEGYRISVGPGCWISLFDGHKYFGTLIFTEDQPLLRPRKTPNGAYAVYLPLSRFDTVIGILRYEKPVSLFYLPDSAQENQGITAYISTLEEPTGEEELGFSPP